MIKAERGLKAGHDRDTLNKWTLFGFCIAHKHSPIIISSVRLFNFFVKIHIQRRSFIRNSFYVSLLYTYTRQYSRASHIADFRDEKNQECFENSVLSVIIQGHQKILHLGVSVYSLYYKVSVHQIFFELIKNLVSSKSGLKEAMYKEALLYIVLQLILGHIDNS